MLIIYRFESVCCLSMDLNLHRGYILFYHRSLVGVFSWTVYAFTYGAGKLESYYGTPARRILSSFPLFSLICLFL